MRKASRILFLIGAILAILGFFAFIGLGIFMLVLYGMVGEPDAPAWLAELLQKIAQEFKTTTPQNLLAACGALFLVFSLFSIPAAVLSFICKGKEKAGLGLIIPAMALSLFAGSTLSVLGGIFGIIACAQENKAASAPKTE